MIAIRGATTVDFDSPENIKESVEELMLEIKNKNGIADGDFVCIIFSSTADLRSYYPATAAREAGLTACPLFSAAEPDIEGSLPKCIRVLALAEKHGKPVHVYLRDAKNLRKDLNK